MNSNLEIPGPFVVLQGIPGDGLAHTMLQDDVDDEFFDWDDYSDTDDYDEMEAVEEANNNDSNPHHEEAHQASTSAMGGTRSAVSAAALSTTATSGTTAFLGQGLLNSYVSAAPVSSTTALATGSSTGAAATTTAATATSSPFDAVRPTVLPTISDATGGGAASATASTAAAISAAASSQRRHAANNNNDVDDFVVVDDGNQNTGSSATHHAEENAAALSRQQAQQAATQEAPATATASLPEQQHLQEEEQQLSRTNERAQRMIRVWENCSRSRVAHQRREWVMNAKATAPELVTLDIEPWLAPTTHQLSVFDQLPTNTALLNKHARSTSNNKQAVVSSTAEMVGSLAPGTMVVGSALFTFEIISSNSDSQQRSLANFSDNNLDVSSHHSSPGCLVGVSVDTAADSGLRFCQKETCRDGHSQYVLAPKLGRLQFLQLSSGGGPDDRYKDCFVLYSIHGYTVLGGAGMSAAAAAVYALPDTWFWKVTCPLGAYVREGLDLTSRLKEVLPYGTVCRVQRKLVNAHGLARLSIRAMILPEDDDEEETAAQDHSSSAAAASTAVTTSSSVASLTHQSSNDSSASSSHRRQGLRHPSPPCRLVEGWISQYLNPLSGQGGPIVQPISFCVPALYRVTLPSGAVIRQEIELCSPQIGLIPCGSVVTVTGRAFSEFPADQCIERLRLAPGNSYCNGHGGGWISVRLNKKPPEDQLIVQYAGFDPSFDPNQPGLFHYRQSRAAASAARAAATREQEEEQLFANAAAAVAAPMAQHVNQQQPQQPMNLSVHEISSIDENESRSSLSSSSGGGSGTLATATRPSGTTTTTTTTAVNPHTSRRRRRPDMPASASASSIDNSCLCCIDKARNATMVHGSTGHIACCLDCARMLKASGQPCPVCRLQIDSVILHYWA